MKTRDFSPFDFRVIETDKASSQDLETIFALFEMNYRQAKTNLPLTAQCSSSSGVINDNCWGYHTIRFITFSRGV